MNLFDMCERSYTGYKLPNESSCAFLNRSALLKFERTRDLLENWFLEYPPAQQVKLGTDFRSDRDTQHLGAFFELYCYTLLRQQGFIVNVEQVVDTTVNRPIDFLVQSGEFTTFYLEATVATDANTILANQRKIWELIDTLNSLNEPFFQIGMEVEEESSQNLSLSQIRSGIHAWLETLEPDKVTMQKENLEYEDHPHWTWERDGWSITFFAIPRSSENCGMPGETVLYHSWDARRISAQNALLKALESKADRYGSLQLPYIIAVDVLALDSLGTDIGETLFGKEVALWDTHTDEITLTRAPLLPDRSRSENGLWFARRGPRNQQVSAVLLVHELLPWSIASKTPVLWHNPYAEKPINPDLWQGPQMIPDMDASPPQMQYRNGEEAYEMFHLSPTWQENNSEEDRTE
jgi:hypothetical protein